MLTVNASQGIRTCTDLLFIRAQKHRRLGVQFRTTDGQTEAFSILGKAEKISIRSVADYTEAFMKPEKA